MPGTQVTIIAYLTILPGTEQGFLARFGSLAANTRAEPGCINYDFHRHTTEPHRFVFYENYVDQAAFDSHLNQPHTLEWIEYAHSNGAYFNVEHWSMLTERECK